MKIWSTQRVSGSPRYQNWRLRECLSITLMIYMYMHPNVLHRSVRVRHAGRVACLTPVSHLCQGCPDDITRWHQLYFSQPNSQQVRSSLALHNSADLPSTPSTSLKKSTTRSTQHSNSISTTKTSHHLAPRTCTPGSLGFTPDMCSIRS